MKPVRDVVVPPLLKPGGRKRVKVRLIDSVGSRKTPKLDFPPKDIEILQPINLDLLVTRNLSAAWFSEIPGVQVQGVLRSLTVSLSIRPLFS